MNGKQVDIYCQQMSSPNTHVIESANQQLTDILQNPDSWQIADYLIDHGTCSYSRFFGGKLFKNAIETQWSALNIDARDHIKNFVTSKLISLSERYSYQSTDLQGLISALVALIIREWPQNWESIMLDLISSINNNPFLLKINLTVIQRVSQDVMEFNEGYITSNRWSQLHAALESHSSHIFGIVENILSGSSNVEDSNIALKTLKSIIKWLEPSYIYETELLVSLCQHYLPSLEYQDSILGIFGEIANMNTPSKFLPTIPEIFHTVIEAISMSISSDANFVELYMENSERISSLVFLIGSFVENHILIIEQAGKYDALDLALTWSVKIMIAIPPPNDLFKTNVDLWTKVSKHYFFDQNRSFEFYNQFFPTVRRILARNMERPEEILIIQKEDGSVSREQQKNTSTVILFKSMHDALCVLTNIDFIDTMESISEMITENRENFSITNINRICWSAGAISGAIPADEEKKFVLSILKELLDLFGTYDESENQAILASGIMFVCSRYPRFLMEHWPVMKVIIEKLIDFMHSSFDGIMDMAVDSFKTIAENCKRQFLIPHQGDNRIYLEILLENMYGMISDLNTELIISIFGAFSKIISGLPDEGQRSVTVRDLMNRINERWVILLQSMNFSDIEMLKEIIFILKTNSIVASNVGSSYHVQFSFIFNTLIDLYTNCYTPIETLYNQFNDHAPQRNEFSLIIEIKSICLNVIEMYISKLNNTTIIKNTILPHIIDTIIQEYLHSSPDSRTVNVLNLLTTTIKKIGESMSPHLPLLFNTIIIPTVDMIKDDFESYINYRESYIYLISEIVTNCYKSLWQMGEEEINLLYGSIMWGCKHPNHNICNASLTTMLELFQVVDSKGVIQFKNAFFSTFYIQALNLSFEILTDTIHKFAFLKQVELIKKLLQLNIDQNDSSIIADILIESFPNRDKYFFVGFINHLKTIARDAQELQRQLKDFLIELQQYSIMDPELNPENKILLEKQIAADNEKILGLNGPILPTDDSFLE